MSNYGCQGSGLPNCQRLKWLPKYSEDVPMSDGQRELENLLVDEEKINEELLHDLLSDYIQIGKQSGDLIPQSEFDELDSKQKVTVVLLAQRARNELDLVDGEWLTPTEISDQSGIKKNTVYPTVSQLDDEGLVENEDGEYRVPAHNLQRAKDYIYRSESDE